MKKTALAVGLVIILGGLVSLALARYTTITSKSDNIQGIKEVDWSVSREFNASEAIGFSFRPHGDWSLFSYLMYSLNLSGEVLSIKYLEASVESSQLKKTTMRIPLVIDINKGPTGVTVFQDYYEIFNQTSYDWVRISPARGFSDPNGSITIEKGYPNVDEVTGDEVFQLGKISMAGQYKLSCALDPLVVEDAKLNETNPNQTIPWIHPATPPAYLALYRTRTFTDYPYAAFLPAGASVSVVGAVVAAWGIRGDRRQARHAKLMKETKSEKSPDMANPKR